MKTYHGSCHCGVVTFKARMDLSSITQCNCSICSKKGSLHHRISQENFKLLSGEDDLTLYQFDSKEAKHLFCKYCGIHSFSHPRFDPKMVSVNVRCLDDFDVQTENYDLTQFDGKNWEQAVAKIRKESKNKS
ncbi:MAG TPA: GFA family protein [Leucothrix mucor]|nr:GFA family protein [Leucothrix mucor]